MMDFQRSDSGVTSGLNDDTCVRQEIETPDTGIGSESTSR